MPGCSSACSNPMTDTTTGGIRYFAAAVLAVALLCLRALWWGVLGTLSVAGYTAIKAAERVLGSPDRWDRPERPEPLEPPRQTLSPELGEPRA